MMLKAKDAIGIHFYQEQTPTHADDLVDHFDKFTLQLSGALDALAMAVRIVLRISRPTKRQANFRNQAFRREVASKGSGSLRNILDDPEFEAFQTVLAELRNSIHKVAPMPQYGEIEAEPPVLSVALDGSSPNFPVKSPYGSPGSVKLLVPPTCFWGGTRFEVPRFS